MVKGPKNTHNKPLEDKLSKSPGPPTLAFLTLLPLSTLAEYKIFLVLAGLILFIIVVMRVFPGFKRIKVWFLGMGTEVEMESPEKSPEKVGITDVNKIQSQGPVIGQQEIGQARDIYQGPVTFPASPELEERVRRVEEAVKQLSPAPPRKEIEKQFDADILKEQLAASVLEISRIKMELGLERLKDKRYEEAIKNLRESLKPLPEESEAAASILWNLGIALIEWPKGNRFDNLENAVEAYNKVLNVYTREKSPENFAGAQNNLGNAYADLAGGRDREDNLKEAIAAYDRALKVCTLEAFPVNYAMTQNNLGTAYADLAAVRDREANLDKAIKVYKEVICVRTLEAFPIDYAMTQNNLGNAYADLAGVRDREANLDKAIAAYDRALKVRTLEAFPVDYAMTQNNLGTAYADLAWERGTEKSFGLAIDAYKEALRVRTLEAFPVDYAMTQNNLGIAYRNLAGVRDTETEKNLGLAINALKEALRVYTLEAFPIDYAGTKFNVGLLYLSTAEMYCEKEDKVQEKESLKQAETAFIESLNVFKKEKMGEWIEKVNKGLAFVRDLLGQIKE